MQRTGTLVQELGSVTELLCLLAPCTWTTVAVGVLLPHSKFNTIHLNLNENPVVSDLNDELGDRSHFIDQSQATSSHFLSHVTFNQS